jgi:hypothetical protein
MPNASNISWKGNSFNSTNNDCTNFVTVKTHLCEQKEGKITSKYWNFYFAIVEQNSCEQKIVKKSPKQWTNKWNKEKKNEKTKKTWMANLW